jgi:hypothetical protein
MSQGIQKQVGVFPTIETERHLFAVGLEMLGANLVPRSHYSALEQGESGFDSVGVNVALDVDVELVANRLVASLFTKLLCCASVASPIVGIQNFDIFAQVFPNVLFESSALCILGVKEAEIAATLPYADYDFLVIVRSGVASPVALLATDEGFVHLHLAAQHWPIDFDHGGSDAVAEVPRGLVADSQGSLDLTGRHSFLGLTEQQSSYKPLAQGQVRIVENCSGGYAELVVATSAVEELFFGFQLDRVLFAAQATNAIGKAEAAEQFSASFIGRELGHQIGHIHTHREAPNGREEKRAA